MNNYYTLGTYEGYYNNLPSNTNNKIEPSVSNTVTQPILENFGSFSIMAAVRYPYSQLRSDPTYIQPKLPGVN